MRRRALIGDCGVPWTPARLGSALFGWWDPSDAATLTLSSSKVTAIKDKGAGGRNLAVSPALATTTVNSRKALTLPGSQVLSFVASSPFYTTGLSLACVAKATIPTGSARPRYLSIGDTREYGQDYGINGYLCVQGDPTPRIEPYTNGSTTGSPAPFTAAVGVLTAGYSSSKDGDSDASWTTWNGGARGGDAGNYAFYVYSQYLYLFSSQQNGAITGTGAEAFLSTARLTPVLEATFQGYLAWGWGTQASLPSSHRFRNGRPYARLPAGFRQTRTGLLVPNGAPRTAVPGWRLAA